MKPNSAVPPSVWIKFESLPLQTRPQRGAKPAKRLTALAHELASDEILPGAGKKAHAEMHLVLDTAQQNFKSQIEKKRDAVMMVDGKTVVADMRGKTKIFNDFLDLPIWR
jgi:type III restriction enzyme